MKIPAASGIFPSMPIYDFQCKRCKRRFEALVKINASTKCPECGAAKPERLFTPMASVSTTTTREKALASGRSKAGAQKKEKDRAHQEYMRKHMEDHH